MALAVANQWTGAANFSDLQVITTPTPGNWLVACVGWRMGDGTMPPLNLGDLSRNLWTLLASPTTLAYSSHASSLMQAEIWVCPAATFEGWDSLRVFASTNIAALDTGSLMLHVAEVSGMVNGFLTVDSVTAGSASAATSLSIVVPAPSGGVNCLVVGAAMAATSAAAITATGVGFTALTQVSETVPDAKLQPQWRTATVSVTPSWSSGATAVDWCGVAVAIRETGVSIAQPSANWPIARYQVGLGYDMTTPLSAVQWTDQSTRFVDVSGSAVFSATRGIQYELGQASSEPADLMIRNDDGAYTPRDVNAAAPANAVGTTTTIKIADANAAGIHVSDLFRLKTAALVLKELTVFQVSGVASVAGTTTVTFARADGVAGGAQAATASGDVYAGIQMDTHIPWRKIDYWGGKWFPAAVGWFGSLPQTWRDSSWGMVPAVGIDPLATLTAGNPSAADGEILRRSPTHYWPLTDPGVGNSDSENLGTAQDASGNGQRPLQQVISKFGRGANNVADFGASTQDLDTALMPPIPTSLLGDSGTGWQQSGLTAAEMPTKGYALVGQSDAFPSITTGVTIMGASVVPLTADLNAIAAAAFNGTMMIIRNTDPALAIGQGAIIKLSIDKTTLWPSVSVWDKDTHARTDVTAASGPALVLRFWSAWFLTFDRTSWALYLGDTTPSISGSCDLVDSFGEIDIGGEADEFFHGRFWNGVHSKVAVFNRRLTGQECFNLYRAVVSGTVDLTTADRVSRKLDSVGWAGTRIITPSDNQIANEGDDPGSVTDLLNDIAGYEDGLFFTDAAGQAQWRGHLAGYFQTVRQVLGEDTASGEIPFQPSPEMPYDLTYLYNKVEISNASTRLFSRVTTLFPAADPPPYPKGLRTLPRDTRLSSTADAWGLSWWLLSRYRKARLRVTSVEIDCASYPAAWTFCLGAEVGDLVTVKKRPLNAPAISLDCRIIQVKRSEGPGMARFTFGLAAAAPPILILGDPAKAVLGNATIGF